MDRLLAMQTFVRVVETGSFSAVAREQTSTQSAVSKQVAALERHLGVKLLTRTTRMVSLTDDGARYFEQVRRLVLEVDEAEAALREGQQQLIGTLRVAAPAGYGVRVLQTHVLSFLGAHPALKIDLRLNDGFIDLVGEGIDVAVRLGELADSSLIARRIGSVDRVLVAHRAYLATVEGRQGLPRHPQDLRQHACLVYTGSRGRVPWQFSAPDGTGVSVLVEGPLQSNNGEVIRASVQAGLGIAYSPRWLFEDLIARGEVDVLLPDWQARPLPLHLLSPPERSRTSKVRAFADHLVAALRAPAP